MARRVAFLLAVAFSAAGLWLSRGLGPIQIWLFGAGLVGLVGICAETFLRRRIDAEDEDKPAENPFRILALWIAPGLLVTAGLWLEQVMGPDSFLPVAAAVAGLTGAILLGLDAAMRPESRFQRPGRFVANLILYLVVFVMFALIYYRREQAMVTAVATGLVAFLAALELLRPGPARQGLGWKLAAIAGAILAETVLVLDYWPLSGLVGGAVLLLTFYVFSGLLVSIKEGSFNRQTLTEYGTVAVVGMLVILWAVP